MEFFYKELREDMTVFNKKRLTNEGYHLAIFAEVNEFPVRATRS